MPTSNDGIMVILSSPSGAGKTTLVKLLSKKKKILKYQFPILQGNHDQMKFQKKITILSQAQNLID